MKDLIAIGVDATNISSGGGVTHLVQLLAAATPSEAGVGRIHVWTTPATAKKLPLRDWLVCHSPKWCNGGLLRRFIGQQWQIPRMLDEQGCDVIFSPGGTLPMWCGLPRVTMSQNMLPFESNRALLFGRWSWMRLKMRLLRHSQAKSFGSTHGLVFLTQYAEKVIKTSLNGLRATTAVIPHGIESRFVLRPRPQRQVQNFLNKPFQLLYVSIQMPYKHHIEVMQAVTKLRGEGVSVVLTMVGENSGPYGKAVLDKRSELDPQGKFIKDLGHVDFARLHALYRSADAFVFASSCENLPNILIEAMAAGLPIASSDRGPMPDVLGDAGIYFDPEVPDSIADALRRLASDDVLRARLARSAWQESQAYSWEVCARDTLRFIVQVTKNNGEVHV